MLTYATWYISSWIERCAATRAAVLRLSRRVVEAGAQKQATRTGMVHVFAKSLRDSLVLAVAQHDECDAPDLRRAMASDVDWYALAEHFIEIEEAA